MAAAPPHRGGSGFTRVACFRGPPSPPARLRLLLRLARCSLRSALRGCARSQRRLVAGRGRGSLGGSSANASARYSTDRPGLVVASRVRVVPRVRATKGGLSSLARRSKATPHPPPPFGHAPSQGAGGAAAPASRARGRPAVTAAHGRSRGVAIPPHRRVYPVGPSQGPRCKQVQTPCNSHAIVVNIRRTLGSGQVAL